MQTEKILSQTSIQKQNVCIDPKFAVGKDKETMQAMFQSHDWQVEEGKSHGTIGLMIRFKCAKCGVVGHAICESA
jgi:hypothetical protein